MDGLLELSASALRLGIPVAICALGALWSERSGVVNIGLEGMMLTGAFWGAAGAYWYGPAAGILLAVAAGLAMALLHAAVTVSGEDLKLHHMSLSRSFASAPVSLMSPHSAG